MTINIQELAQKKSEIESQLAKLAEVLQSQGVDMTTPLVDREGFPRSDIDLYAITTTRQQIVRLRNDYAAITEQVSKALANVHEQARLGVKPDEIPSLPFARVNSVADQSPAWDSGLRAGDLIHLFGTIHHGNSNNLQALPRLVADNENIGIPVKISRNDEIIRLELIPRKWSGRGLLGCHIVPL